MWNEDLGITTLPDYQEDLDYLLDRLSLAARFGQLAEEASELAQAALKCQRFLMEENPPEKDFDDLWNNLGEELADVMVCSDVAEVPLNLDIYRSKLRRWAERLRKDANGQNDG